MLFVVLWGEVLVHGTPYGSVQKNGGKRLTEILHVDSTLLLYAKGFNR